MTELEKMIAEFDRQNANLSDDRQEEVPTESPKTNEWGEPVYSFEEPVEVEGARLNDFLIPTIFKQKSNAKSETALPKATKEEKPYNPEGLLPIAESGQAEMPQSFISPKVFKEFTPEEKLMLDVDKATDNAFGVVQQEASAQSVNEELSKTPWQRAFENDTYEATKNQVSLRQTTGADAVIKRTFESISADDINSIIESRVANNEEFKAKKQAFDDEVKRIMPNSNDNLSDAEVKALFANMTPEEREAAEKQIAETTQALEALQTRFATDVGPLLSSTRFCNSPIISFSKSVRSSPGEAKGATVRFSFAYFSFFCKKKSKSEGGGDHGLTVTFESFIRNMDDHIKFREFFFQHFGSFIDDLVAALSAGNTSEQQV